MKLNDTTPTQDSILSLLNIQSNPKNTPPDSIFVNSLVSDYLDSLVASYKKSTVAQPLDKIVSIADKLSAQDAQALADIASRY